MLAFLKTLKNYLPISRKQHEKILHERTYLLNDKHRIEIAKLNYKVTNILDSFLNIKLRNNATGDFIPDVTFSMTVSGNLLSGLTDYSREEVIKDIAFEIGKRAEYKALYYFKNGRNYQYEL